MTIGIQAAEFFMSTTLPALRRMAAEAVEATSSSTKVNPG
jgi:hypothetical protein